MGFDTIEMNWPDISNSKLDSLTFGRSVPKLKLLKYGPDFDNTVESD